MAVKIGLLQHDLAVEQRLVQRYQGVGVVVLPIDLGRLGRDRFDCEDRDARRVLLQCRQRFRINGCSNLRRSVVLPTPVGPYSTISDGGVG